MHAFHKIHMEGKDQYLGSGSLLHVDLGDLVQDVSLVSLVKQCYPLSSGKKGRRRAAMELPETDMPDLSW